jgi:hypothetical protein
MFQRNYKRATPFTPLSFLSKERKRRGKCFSKKKGGERSWDLSRVGKR